MSQITYIPTVKGKKILALNNYLYNLSGVTDDGHYFWTCKTKHCSSRVIIKDNVVKGKPSNHAHDSDEKLVKELIFKETLKEEVQIHYKVPVSVSYKKAVAKRANLAEADESVPSLKRIKRTLYKARREKNSSLPESNHLTAPDDSQKNLDGQQLNSEMTQGNLERSELLEQTNEDFSSDIEILNPETESQSGDSSSLLNDSNIIVKEEIIEIEQESSLFDDSSLHSLFTTISTESQFESQTPSTSSTTHSYSSISNAPVEQICDVDMVQPQSIVNDESYANSNVPPNLNISCSENLTSNGSMTHKSSSDKGDLSIPEASNITTSNSSSCADPTQPEIPPDFNIFCNENLTSNESMTHRSSSAKDDPSIPKASNITTSNSSSCADPTQPEIPPDLNRSNELMTHRSSSAKGDPSIPEASNITTSNSSPCANPTQHGTPSDLNISNSENLAPVESMAPRSSSVTVDPSHPTASNISALNSSSHAQLTQPEIPSSAGFPSPSQVSNNFSNGNTENREFIHSVVSPNCHSSFPPKDEFDAYGEFIASKLRSLDLKTCTFVKTAFADLLFKVELKIFSKRREQRLIQSDPFPNRQCENTSSSSRKENIQPCAPTENQYITRSSCMTASESSPGRHTMAYHTLNTPFPPFTCSNTSASIQHNYRSPVGNPWSSPHYRFTAPENLPATHPNLYQTRISSHIRPPYIPSAYYRDNSWNNMPIQHRPPFHARPRDDFDSFGEFVAFKLRDLDPESRAFVQTTFTDLLFKSSRSKYRNYISSSRGERSISLNKTNGTLKNIPPVFSNLLKNVSSNVSRFETQQPHRNVAPSGLLDAQVPRPNMPSVTK